MTVSAMLRLRSIANWTGNGRAGENSSKTGTRSGRASSRMVAEVRKCGGSFEKWNARGPRIRAAARNVSRASRFRRRHTPTRIGLTMAHVFMIASRLDALARKPTDPPWLAGAASEQDDLNRVKEYQEIQKGRQVLDVVKVVLELLDRIIE